MNRRGVTLIEGLIALVITAIAMFALVLPFVADPRIFGSGISKTESQRDAEIVMRTIAQFARESSSYLDTSIGSTGSIDFFHPDNTQLCFKGGPNFESGSFEMGCAPTGGSAGGSQVKLIDGTLGRSKVNEFSITEVIDDRLVRIRLHIEHKGREDEILETELFLRNGT